MEKKNGIFGKRLKLQRAKHEKSQEEVANAIKVSRARYSHYENNHVEPDLDIIKRLADFYNVSSDYLLGITDNPKNNIAEIDIIQEDEEDYKTLNRYGRKMTPLQRKKAIKILEATFEELFDDED